MRCHFFHGLVMLLLLQSYGANAQLFTADIANSEWVASSNSSVCTLAHTIPGFGKAVFTHKSGGGETLTLEWQGKIAFPAGATSIETLPPTWRPNVAPMSLGSASAVAGSLPIKLTAVQTAPLLVQLVNGIRVVFISSPGAPNVKSSKGSAGIVRVILEAKNFAPAYKTYQQCTGEYVAPKETARPGTGQSGVTTSTDVSRVASYIKRDSSVYGASANDGKRLTSAATQTFAADVRQADWKAKTNPFVCSLVHNIPGFGQAVFSRKSGGEEVFYLEPQEKIAFPIGVATMQTLPPIWRSDLVPVDLGKVTAVAGDQPIKLDAAQISQLVTQLTGGTKVMFVSQSMSDSSSSNFSSIQARSGVMRVVLETKNFVAAHKTYQACLGEMIPYSFAQVARIVINYPEKPNALSPVNKIELAKVARYSKADANVLGILVDAHSDSTGTAEANDAIAKQEAEWISAYLVEQGIPSDKIKTRWHGDKYPIASNKTPEGRAQNRRATVRLDTEATRQEIERKILEIKAAAEKEEREKAEIEKAEHQSLAQLQGQTAGTGAPVTGAHRSVDSTDKSDSKSSSSRGRMTPEEIRKLVEGLDLINGQ